MIFATAFAFIHAAPCVSSSAGEIRGTITDQASNQTLPGASVSYYEGGQLRGTTADENGFYKIKPLDPGIYELTFSFIGYQKVTRQNVSVSSGQITFLDIALNNDNTLPEVIISTFPEPLIKKDYAGGHIKILPADIRHSVVRDIRGMVAQTATVYQEKEGGSLNIRGSRANATQYYVDGIRMLGGFNIPKSAIQEITVISGSVPAQYGDATGGIVVITTKSAFNH